MTYALDYSFRNRCVVTAVDLAIASCLCVQGGVQGGEDSTHPAFDDFAC